jgi:hypothetical protein
MAVSRKERREERRARVEAVFGEKAGYGVLDLLELVEFAWHDCYAEITPPDHIIDEILFCSEGDVLKLMHAARLAVDDWRDLKVWAQTLRAEAEDSKT